MTRSVCGPGRVGVVPRKSIGEGCGFAYRVCQASAKAVVSTAVNVSEHITNARCSRIPHALISHPDSVGDATQIPRSAGGIVHAWDVCRNNQGKRGQPELAPMAFGSGCLTVLRAKPLGRQPRHGDIAPSDMCLPTRHCSRARRLRPNMSARVKKGHDAQTGSACTQPLCFRLTRPYRILLPLWARLTASYMQCCAGPLKIYRERRSAAATAPSPSPSPTHTPTD